MVFQNDCLADTQVQLVNEGKRSFDEKHLCKVEQKSLKKSSSVKKVSQKNNPEEHGSWGSVLKSRQNFNEMHWC